MKRLIKWALFGFFLFVFIFAGYFFVGSVKPAEEIAWGVNFSQKHAENLGIDWQKTYLAVLDDLGAKKIKIISHWDFLEPESGKYNFEDLDWQIEKAKERQAKVLLVVGMKTGHWPECHIPEWAKGLGKKDQQSQILKLLEEIVIRYRGATPVWAWQVENEALFPFGECPWQDKAFLKKEIDLVKSLDDKNRPIIISDSGEFSFWITAAKLGDVVGTTLHRNVWFKELKRYVKYPLKPIFYWRKSRLVNFLFGKHVMVGELQAEPWCLKYLSECSLSEQAKTMDFEQFKNNIEFAKNTGLSQHYLWGAEWWYWMKEKQNRPEIWEEAKKLF